MNPLLYFNNDPVKVFKHLYIRYNQILFSGDYQKIYEQYENIVFTLPSLAAAIIFGFPFVHCFRVIGIWNVLWRALPGQKTALETKGASKNRAEKDYEVVDLGVTENTETKFPNYRRQLNNG